MESNGLLCIVPKCQNLGYFELGPKVSLLRQMDKIQGNTASDVKSNFNNTNFAGVLGFGANILGNDGRFSGILGLRFEYGFTDIVKNRGHRSSTSSGCS